MFYVAAVEVRRSCLSTNCVLMDRTAYVWWHKYHPQKIPLASCFKASIECTQGLSKHTVRAVTPKGYIPLFLALSFSWIRKVLRSQNLKFTLISLFLTKYSRLCLSWIHAGSDHCVIQQNLCYCKNWRALWVFAADYIIGLLYGRQNCSR